MTGAEKRYFKLYCMRHVSAGQGIHAELFDAIAAMTEYDEPALRKVFAGSAFMRRFPITKRRLYEALLHSLDAFHAGSSVDDKLRRLMHHVELLFNKALYADAMKALHSAQLLARANDRQAILLQVMEWERRMMERANYSGIGENELNAHAEAVESVINEWREVEDLWQAKSSSFLLIYRSGQAPDQHALEALRTLARAPLLAKNAKLHTARARFLHHHVRGALAFAQNDLSSCETELSACAEVLRAEARHFHAEPDLMLGVMGNLSHVRMRLGKHQQALDGFRDFRKLPLLLAQAPSPDLRMKLFVMGSSLELSVLAVKGEFSLAAERLADLEEGLAQYGGRASTVRRAELELQAAYACFGAGMQDRALRWCNRLLSEKGIEAHTGLLAIGRMMNLAVLVELRKTELLDYILRNTRRYLKQHGGVFAVENLLLDHVQALIKAKDSPSRYALWKHFAHAMATLCTDAREAALLDHIDLLAWAQARADDKPFHELVKTKWLAQNRPGKAGGNKRAA